MQAMVLLVLGGITQELLAGLLPAQVAAALPLQCSAQQLGCYEGQLLACKHTTRRPQCTTYPTAKHLPQHMQDREGSAYE